MADLSEITIARLIRRFDDRYVIVGDDDADPSVARIIARDAEGNFELDVLPGCVESHHDLLTRA